MLYIFTKSVRSAGGSRHRAFFIADFLKERGYKFELVIPPVYHTETTRTKARWDYLKIIFSLRKNDIVFLQNPIFSNYFIICICLIKIVFRPKFIFDFDDATWVQKPLAPRVLAYFSDKFIVASHYLAEWSPLKGKPVMVMTNLVDYTLAQRYKAQRVQEPVVLGWMGGAPLSLHNIKVMLPALKQLVQEGVKFKLLLIGSLGSKEVVDTLSLPGLNIEFVDKLDWGKEGEIQKGNSRFDIGVCPLVDNESNRGRCSLKILDYMAAGIPVLASPIGENIYFVDDGKTGYLPATTEEWVEKIKKLVEDEQLRKKMGQASLNKLIEQYSYQRNIDKYIEFLGLTK